MKKILALQPKSGLFLDLQTDRFPTRVYGWDRESFELRRQKDKTAFYGIVTKTVNKSFRLLHCKARTTVLDAGTYFAAPEFYSNGGSGVVVEIQNNDCLPMIGGPIEEKGRIPYINGCTDTLLISPPQKGDACVNLLHIPPGVKQTNHVHPSLRIGYIVRGECICHTDGPDIPLEEGMVFYIPENTLHGFETTDSEMLAIAWHPDSDFGPTADDHPMLNRTIVDGTSASKIESIKTK